MTTPIGYDRIVAYQTLVAYTDPDLGYGYCTIPEKYPEHPPAWVEAHATRMDIQVLLQKDLDIRAPNNKFMRIWLRVHDEGTWFLSGARIGIGGTMISRIMYSNKIPVWLIKELHGKTDTGFSLAFGFADSPDKLDYDI